MKIYVFGLTMTLCLGLFLWMIRKLAARCNYNHQIFTKNVLWLFLGTFIASRLFYIIGRWNDMKFIKDPVEFFIMDEYNFSLFWAIFGFLGTLSLLTFLEKSTLRKYIDGVVITFFAMAFIGFIGAFFGGQVYGRETLFPVSITYTHPYSIVPYQVPVFPLPLVYAAISFVLFWAFYILSLFTRVRGYIGYFGIISFCSVVLALEFFSGKQDILSVQSSINLPQVYACVLWIFAMFQLARVVLSREGTSVKTLDIS